MGQKVAVKEVETKTQPEPNKMSVKTMTFPEAIQEVMIGKRIQRLEWHDSEYGLVKDDFLCIHRREVDYRWEVSMGDMLAEDWVSF